MYRLWLGGLSGEFPILMPKPPSRYLPVVRLQALPISLPPIQEQKPYTAFVAPPVETEERARAAAEAQLETVRTSQCSTAESLSTEVRRVRLADRLNEIASGVGESWGEYRVIGATRADSHWRKSRVAGKPQRYKLVGRGTVSQQPDAYLFWVLSRLWDEGEEPGIKVPIMLCSKASQGVSTIRPGSTIGRARQWAKHSSKTLAVVLCVNVCCSDAWRKPKWTLPAWDVQVPWCCKAESCESALPIISEQIDTIDRIAAALLRSAFNGELV